MKKQLTLLLAGFCALALMGRCARSEAPAEAEGTTARPAPVPQRLVATPTPEGATRTYEVRLLGYDPGTFTSVLFDIASLSASAGGVPLTVEPGAANVDLAEVQQAWLLGRVTVPSGVSAVDFSLAFDDAGAFESPAESGAIDSRHITISWTAPVASLRENGHAVVVIDLTDSLVSTGQGGRALVPRLVIQY